MSKKNKQKGTEAPAETVQPETATETPAETPAATEATPAATPAATVARSVVMHRPLVTGEVIEKKGRDGSVKGTITILDGGKIDYKGTVYNSLSAAALANSKDLGLATKAIDGWAWWGLKDRKSGGERTPRASNLPARRTKIVEAMAKVQAKVDALAKELAEVDAAIAAEAAKAPAAAEQPAA